MKKFIFSILLIVCCFIFFGCQNTNNISSTESESTIPNATIVIETTDAIETTETVTMPETNGFPWTFETPPTVVFENSKFEKVEATPGTYNTIITTPFNYNIKDIKKVVYKNKFITNTYALSEATAELELPHKYPIIGTKSSYKTKESIRGCYKSNIKDTTKEYNDFSISVLKNTNNYTNVTDIQIAFKDLKLTPQNQENVFSLIKTVTNDKYAKTLVYGKDLDGKNYCGDKIDNYSFDELYHYDDIVYRIKRHINITDKKENIGDIFFSVGVYSNNVFNNYNHYSNDYKSIMSQFKYTPINVLSKSSKNSDKIYIFDDYKINSSYICKLKADNGTVLNSAFITASKKDDNIYSEAEYYYHIYENEKDIFDSKINIKGIIKSNQTSYTSEEMFDLTKKQIKAIMGDELDIDFFTFDMLKEKRNNQLVNTLQIICPIAGQKELTRIHIKLNQTSSDGWTGNFEITN